MGILTITTGFAIFVILVAMFLYLTRIEKNGIDLVLKCVELGESHKDEFEKLTVSFENQFKDLEKRANPPAHVSDPFKGQKEIYQTKKHIVVPKTPTEIRNENFEEIKKGAEYGSAN